MDESLCPKVPVSPDPFLLEVPDSAPGDPAVTPELPLDGKEAPELEGSPGLLPEEDDTEGKPSDEDDAEGKPPDGLDEDDAEGKPLDELDEELEDGKLLDELDELDEELGDGKLLDELWLEDDEDEELDEGLEGMLCDELCDCVLEDSQAASATPRTPITIALCIRSLFITCSLANPETLLY